MRLNQKGKYDGDSQTRFGKVLVGSCGGGTTAATNCFRQSSIQKRSMDDTGDGVCWIGICTGCKSWSMATAGLGTVTKWKFRPQLTDNASCEFCTDYFCENSVKPANFLNFSLAADRLLTIILQLQDTYRRGVEIVSIRVLLDVRLSGSFCPFIWSGPSKVATPFCVTWPRWLYAKIVL